MNSNFFLMIVFLYWCRTNISLGNKAPDRPAPASSRFNLLILVLFFGDFFIGNFAVFFRILLEILDTHWTAEVINLAVIFVFNRFIPHVALFTGSRDFISADRTN